MMLPKNEEARNLFITLFVRAMEAEKLFNPVTLFTEEDKQSDVVATAEALSLLQHYCVVYRSGPDAGKWSLRPMTIYKYQNGYYDQYGIPRKTELEK